MKLFSRKLSKKVIVTTGVGLGLGLAILGLGNSASADEAPQTVNVGNSSKIVSYSSGHAERYGAHRVAVIQEAGTGQYLFCIEWSKKAPSNEQISKRYQANPSVQWLVNNFYSDHRFQSLGQGDEGDYWLYQAVIHWVADPDDHATWGGGAIQDVLDQLDPAVRAKIEALRNEALKHNDESTSEIVTNNHNLGFDPSKLEINKDDLQGNTYKKTFTLKSENMSNVSVWLKNAPEGVSLTGKDNAGVNFKDVWNNTGLQINIPYKVNAEKDSYTFTVATKGNWEKTSKVAWIYQGNGDTQKVAKQDVKAVSVPLDAETDMDVTVKPAKGSVQFIKKGTGNNNSDRLGDTEFKLTGGDFSQTKKTDANGYIKFDNLPLGRDYELTETAQPNRYYRTMYHTTITNLNGDNPLQTYDLKDVFNKKDHQKFRIVKKDSQGNPLKGAQFVLVRSDSENAHISVEEAKKKAYRQVGDELVEGHTDQEPYVATSDEKGEVFFDMVETKARDTANYYAVEIKSPDNYTLSQTSVKLLSNPESPSVVEGELQDTTNTLPATGSEKLLLIGASLVVLGVLGTGVYYFKAKKVN
ncbi:hypothetical protein FC48_GL001778 [Ligilactobacillus murinus DSM 20452 = NBRC 14221]|uniref:SpaA-like prealbumin fold domain-containing protein n=1 Tax=Ligilactobacillus murinus DSM 20452 = NBRC 14221 TaxID=1423772 RepID=A0A0R2ASZ8_9LACO|nr:SpaA isopeptide-forming pilin-related protein [Ligilactobacillus murinus]KRM70253.1 hypothetical protein FC48_GL001778 [Ligilactobacillus murinus DSM 20452 = NBRC 14221]